MRLLMAILVVIFVLLQFRLWVGEGSLAQKTTLEREVAKQQQQNDRLSERNQKLANEVEELKDGLHSVEERARTDLGMIKEGETFYMVVEPEVVEPEAVEQE